MNRLKVVMGGENGAVGGYNQLRPGLDLDEEVNVVDFNEISDSLEGKSPSEIIKYVKEICGRETIPTADFYALVGLPQTRVGQYHIVHANSAKHSVKNRTARNKVLTNLKEIISNAVVVEINPNDEIYTGENLTDAQKHKNAVKEYFRIMVPVRNGNNVQTLVITAENYNGKVILPPHSVSLYEVNYAQKEEAYHQRLRANRMHSDTPLKISIRDMLLGVKGRDGKLLIPLDSFDQFAGENIDNLGENMDNRRGSDEVDERTAREIENEKSAVRENYQGTDAWMKAPNGNPTNLTEDQWLAARTPTFNSEFGDWEKAAAHLKFESQIPIEVKENLISWHEGENVYKQAEKIFTDVYHDEQKIVTPVGIVTVDKNSIHDSLSHRAPQKKLDAVLSLVPGMRNAAYIDTIPDYDNPRVKYHYFAYRTNYKGAEHIVLCRAKEGVHKRRLYVYEVTTREEVQKRSDTLGTQHADVKPSGVLRGIALYTSILHKLLNNVKDNSVSIAVDENGEPIFGGSPNTPKGKAPAVYHTKTESDNSAAYARSADAHTGADPSIPQNQNSVKANESRSENQGGFSDGQNPEAFSQGTKGNTKNFADGTKLVELFANADESTFLHETGHIFLMDLEELAREGDEASKADLAIVDGWAAWHDGDAEKYKNTPWAAEFAKREKYIKEAQKNGVAKMPDGTTKTLDQLLREWKQERFARAFEIYLYEGKAPSKGLRKKNSCVLFVMSVALWLCWASVGGCSESRMYQISENELTALQEHLNVLEQNNETLRSILDGSNEELTAALNALTASKAELTKLKSELMQCRIDAENARKSLETANQELQKARESFKQSEKERDKIEGRLRTQRNIWEALFAVAVGVAIAR